MPTVSDDEIGTPERPRNVLLPLSICLALGVLVIVGVIVTAIVMQPRSEERIQQIRSSTTATTH